MATTVNLILMTQRAKKDGKYPIYLRTIKNRKASYVSTNVSVLLKEWDQAKGKVKACHSNSTRLNAYLRKLEDEYSGSIMDIESSQINISLKGIKRKLNGEDAANFLIVAKELQNKYRIEGKIGSSDKVASILNKFTTYMGAEDTTLQEIDVRLLTNYQNYLTEKLNNRPSSINRDLKFFKTVFYYAQRMEYIPITVNPFRNFTFLRVRTERGFLEPHEITAMEATDCSNIPYVQKAKDIALFQYYSGGLRISDVLALKWSNIIEGRVHLTIIKTGKQTSHRLTQKALEIMEKYRYLNNEYIFGYLPNGFDLKDLVKLDAAISSNTALINKGLKRIAELAGLKKRLSTHLFRHSFATNALQQGMSLEVLQSILNHSNIRETQVYAKVLNQKVDAEIDKLNL